MLEGGLGGLFAREKSDIIAASNLSVRPNLLEGSIRHAWTTSADRNLPERMDRSPRERAEIQSRWDHDGRRSS
jgi:hypothetical protein